MSVVNSHRYCRACKNSQCIFAWHTVVYAVTLLDIVTEQLIKTSFQVFDAHTPRHSLLSCLAELKSCNTMQQQSTQGLKDLTERETLFDDKRCAGGCGCEAKVISLDNDLLEMRAARLEDQKLVSEQEDIINQLHELSTMWQETEEETQQQLEQALADLEETRQIGKVQEAQQLTSCQRIALLEAQLLGVCASANETAYSNSVNEAGLPSCRELTKV